MIKQYCSLQFADVKEEKNKKKVASLGGLEPPTSRLTVERANQLRHRDH